MLRDAAIESQLVIALKTLCGFDVRAIAERLLLFFKTHDPASANTVSSFRALTLTPWQAVDLGVLLT
jgi:hypothetical protein